MKIQTKRQLRKHETCTCDKCLYFWYNQLGSDCAGGHSSFWKTVIESKAWLAWKEYAEPKMRFDFMENEELGIISPKHFEEFLKYTIKHAK